MHLDLDGKIAVVTGASCGIGRAIARTLAEEGAIVIMFARRPEVLERARALVSEVGKAEAHPLDVGDLAALARALQDVVERHGRIDVLVNNAGGARFLPIADMSDEDWRHNFRVNADAPFAAIRSVFPVMARGGGGAVINITSCHAVRGPAGSAGYASSKAALQHLTHVAALEGAPLGIRVNNVEVGAVATEGTEANAEARPEMTARVASVVPMGRWGTPEEVAGAVAFLASGRASYISGATLAVDGALACVFPF
jgi:NAD(P)-dependent dehydrogenase (short-subunit alcohol dehydrogenase family)